MSGPFTLANWNSIIQQVNNLSAHPPAGQSALSPLAEVPAGHLWSVADITAVRNKLLAICASNSFAAPVVQWKKAIIDEINAAINNGWCGPGVLAIGVENDTFDPGFAGHLTNITCSDIAHYRTIMQSNPYLQQLGPQPPTGPQVDWQLELLTWGHLPDSDFTITLDATDVTYPLPEAPFLTRDIVFHANPLPPAPVISVTPLTFSHFNSGALGIYVCFSTNPGNRYLAVMRDGAFGLSLGTTGGGGPSTAVAQVYSSIWQSPGDLSFTIDAQDTWRGSTVVATQTFAITAI